MRGETNSGLPENVLRERVEELLGLAHAGALVDLVQDGLEAEERLAQVRVVRVVGLGGLEDVADEERVEREPLGRLDDESREVEVLCPRVLEHALWGGGESTQNGGHGEDTGTQQRGPRERGRCDGGTDALGLDVLGPGGDGVEQLGDARDAAALVDVDAHERDGAQEHGAEVLRRGRPRSDGVELLRERAREVQQPRHVAEHERRLARVEHARRGDGRPPHVEQRREVVRVLVLGRHELREHARAPRRALPPRHPRARPRALRRDHRVEGGLQACGRAAHEPVGGVHGRRVRGLGVLRGRCAQRLERGPRGPQHVLQRCHQPGMRRAHMCRRRLSAHCARQRHVRHKRRAHPAGRLLSCGCAVAHSFL